MHLVLCRLIRRTVQSVAIASTVNTTRHACVCPPQNHVICMCVSSPTPRDMHVCVLPWMEVLLFAPVSSFSVQVISLRKTRPARGSSTQHVCLRSIRHTICAVKLYISFVIKPNSVLGARYLSNI